MGLEAPSFFNVTIVISVDVIHTGGGLLASVAIIFAERKDH